MRSWRFYGPYVAGLAFGFAGVVCSPFCHGLAAGLALVACVCFCFAADKIEG